MRGRHPNLFARLGCAAYKGDRVAARRSPRRREPLCKRAPRACDVEQTPIRVADFFEVGLARRALDPLLQRRDVLVADYDGNSLNSRPVARCVVLIATRPFQISILPRLLGTFAVITAAPRVGTHCFHGSGSRTSPRRRSRRPPRCCCCWIGRSGDTRGAAVPPRPIRSARHHAAARSRFRLRVDLFDFPCEFIVDRSRYDRQHMSSPNDGFPS
jgi:hypothetical protein